MENNETYLEECNKYFAPLDEIVEAINNNEGICGMTSQELINIVNINENLNADVRKYLS